MRLFVDNLTVIDCSYLDAERGMVGESWICDIVLPGALDSQSMVMDFGLVKKDIKRAIDQWVDHCLLVPSASQAINQIENHSGQVTLSFTTSSGQVITHQSPEDAVCILDVDCITKQSVEHFLGDALREIVPHTVDRVDISLREEVINGPYYHYTHGLKKHDGNCQRIAHGHRSKIEIWKNGELDNALMQQWAARWADITLITESDIVSQDNGRIVSGYEAPQGMFELSMDASRCYVMPTDSTVECIAQHIAEQCKQAQPDAEFTVKAYEGVGKGAIASS